MTRTCRRVVAHVLRLGIVEDAPPDTCIRRTRAGRHQRSAGAFLWFLYSPGNIHHPISSRIGSQFPATEVARCTRVESSDAYGDVHLDPCNDCCKHRPEMSKPVKAKCHAALDGDCTWSHCPQVRDGEPQKTGRHCPLDVQRLK